MSSHESKSTSISKLSWILFAVCALAVSLPCKAAAIELSGDFSFYSKNYGGGSYEWSRHWEASVGYYVLPLSEIEFSAEDVFSKTVISGIEDTALHDQIYSVDWVQSLTPKSWIIQPYFKVGIGQLNRVSSGSYLGGVSAPESYSLLSEIVGVGIRIGVSHVFSIKAEGSTYVPFDQLSTWQDNFSFTSGISISF